jgi:hypothetical protein
VAGASEPNSVCALSMDHSMNKIVN